MVYAHYMLYVNSMQHLQTTFHGLYEIYQACSSVIGSDWAKTSCLTGICQKFWFEF